VIVADTSAIIALINADESVHEQMVELYDRTGDEWVLPAAILPEVDYLLLKRLGEPTQLAFLRDLADARFHIEWGDTRDLIRARELSEKNRTLRMGLVDALVMAAAERLGARAVATLDTRHFGAVKMRGGPQLFPRDL
jgi:uncharacterized protein